MTLRIAITPGEPAGIGPDLAVQLAQQDYAHELVFIGSKSLLEARAKNLGLTLALTDFDPNGPATPGVSIVDVNLNTHANPAKLDPKNAAYVIYCIEKATQLCLDKTCDAIVTGPVHKGIINDANIPFTGHTEFISQLCKAPPAVMLLASERLKVALVTTHIALSEVPSKVTTESLERVLRTLHQSLIRDFAIASPEIWVAGLNPHAGENGHLGKEEIEIIQPLLETLRNEGMTLVGPRSADTLFQASHMDKADAFVAMYHDQGLPIIKTLDFDSAVNISLGLPIIRTSVDHGTALELAGTSKASTGSFSAAIEAAITMANNHRHADA